MIWTFALTVTGIAGLWMVAKSWRGWILYLINEVLWLAYGLSISSTPVIVMAVLWFITGTRNLVVTRRSQHELRTASDLQEVRPDDQHDDRYEPAVADRVPSLCAYREAKHLDETALW